MSDNRPNAPATRSNSVASSADADRTELQRLRQEMETNRREMEEMRAAMQLLRQQNTVQVALANAAQSERRGANEDIAHEAAMRAKVSVKDHPLRDKEVKGSTLSTCKGPFGAAVWWRTTQRTVDEAREMAAAQHPPFPPALELMAIKSFIADATAGSELQPWLEETADGTARLRSFASWDAMKEAIQRRLLTPTLRRNMHAAFHNLELKGNALSDFLNAINTYLGVSGLPTSTQHALKVDKIAAALSVATLAELESRKPGKWLLSCSAAELDELIETLHTLAAENEAAGTKMARPPQAAGGNKQGNSHIAAQSADSEGKSNSSSIASFTPGGARDRGQGKDGKRGGSKRPAWTHEEIAARALKNHAKLIGKGDLTTVTQRVKDRVCRVCGDGSHHTDDCPCTEFQKSN